MTQKVKLLATPFSLDFDDDDDDFDGDDDVGLVAEVKSIWKVRTRGRRTGSEVK